MKKMKLFTSCLLLSGLIFGCSKTVDKFANVSYDSKQISNSSKNVTVADIYNYMHSNNSDAISKKLLTKAMEDQIKKNAVKFGNADDIETLYTQYLNEKFEKTFISSGTDSNSNGVNDAYEYFGDFSEERLVSYLKSEAYDVKCGTGVSAGYLSDSKYFTCDYSDYIEEELNYDIYLKILKVQYLIAEKGDLIDRNKARMVTYYSVKRGTNDDSLNTLKEQVESISKNYNSTDETKIRNIADIAKVDMGKDLEQVKTDAGYIGTSTDSPNYEYLKKFTTCGEKRCSQEDGEFYQTKLIQEKDDYYKTEVVIKTNTSILFESAREVLFSDNVEDYLYKIGDKYYLINPASYSSADKRITDIILYEGAASGSHSSDGLYYLAEVKIIDSSDKTLFADKAKVAEMLIDKVSDSTIFEECFKDIEVDIYDEDIRNKFITSYGDYKGE